jgi:hypothetical protein
LRARHANVFAFRKSHDSNSIVRRDSMMASFLVRRGSNHAIN